MGMKVGVTFRALINCCLAKKEEVAAYKGMTFLINDDFITKLSLKIIPCGWNNLHIVFKLKQLSITNSRN